jgi:hypothetical protein
MFYAYETTNNTVVGPFATEGEARDWMIRAVPPEDRNGTPENAASDLPNQGWDVDALEEITELIDPEFETPAEAETRYADGYADYYPNFHHA